MPRKRIKKTSRGESSILSYQNAYNEHKLGVSFRRAAKKYGINYVSLIRYKKKRDAAINDNNEQIENVSMGYNAHNRVFNEDQEQQLVKYLIRCADIYFGLSTKEIRKLAFELTVKHHLNSPSNWLVNETAGEEWLRSFMKRNPEVSECVAQTTSLSRKTSFNKNNLNAFYDNLLIVMDRDHFQAQDIYSVDEIGITMVQKPDRVVRRDKRQVSTLASAEQDTLVTVAFAANALGYTIPPMFVFTQSEYQEDFIRNGPVESIGIGSPSGWMQNEIFNVFLKHFQKHSNASLTHKVLLILDYHMSYIHINSLDFCKENGIVLLSFPPHCSHKLHPLDTSVHEPFKKAINTACDTWVQNHPDKTMTIYDIPSVITTAIPLALTQANIQAGFQNTGIFPFNRDLFREIDFAPSFKTDKLNLLATDQVETSNPSNIKVAPADETSPLFGSLWNEETLPSLSAVYSIKPESGPSVSQFKNEAFMESQMHTPLEIAEDRATNTPLRQTPVETVTSSLEPGVSPVLRQPSEPRPSTSNESVSSPNIVCTCSIAPPGEIENRDRKTKLSAIYTDDHEKEGVIIYTITAMNLMKYRKKYHV